MTFSVDNPAPYALETGQMVLSDIAVTRLHEVGITTLEQIVENTPAELLQKLKKEKGSGQRVVSEVCRAVTKLGHRMAEVLV